MSISNETRKAFSEVDSFINLLDTNEQEKIPKNLRNIFKNEKDKDYYGEIDFTKSIKNQKLMPETITIIAFLNLKYLCKDEHERKKLEKIYRNNELKYRDKKIKEYNNILNNNNSYDEIDNSLTSYKKSFFKRVVSKIKRFFGFRSRN